MNDFFKIPHSTFHIRERGWNGKGPSSVASEDKQGNFLGDDQQQTTDQGPMTTGQWQMIDGQFPMTYDKRIPFCPVFAHLA
jgi:uncharacterized cupin superfamily protein